MLSAHPWPISCAMVRPLNESHARLTKVHRPWESMTHNMMGLWSMSNRNGACGAMSSGRAAWDVTEIATSWYYDWQQLSTNGVFCQPKTDNKCQIVTSLHCCRTTSDAWHGP